MIDEKGLEAGQRAAMESNGCGCSWAGEHVFCDDPRLPEPDTACQCKKDARAAITAYLSAKSPDNRWPDPLESPQAEAIRAGKIDDTSIRDLFDKMEREIKLHREAARLSASAEPVAWVYEWKPIGINNAWQVHISLEDPRLDGVREYRKVQPLYTHPGATNV